MPNPTNHHYQQLPGIQPGCLVCLAAWKTLKNPLFLLFLALLISACVDRYCAPADICPSTAALRLKTMDPESNSEPMKPAPTDQDAEDAHDLATLGHEQLLTRKFNMWSMLALAFCVLGMFLSCEALECLRRDWLASYRLDELS